MEWRPLNIVEMNIFEGYMISEKGDIKAPDGTLVELNENYGYKILLIRKHVRVHRLVLTAFQGPPPPDKPLCRHLDGNRQNNSIDNLAWGNAQENTQDAVRHGTAAFLRWAGKGNRPAHFRALKGVENPGSRLTEADIIAIRTRAQNETLKAISKDYPVSYNTIGKIVRGEKWAHVAAPITNKYKAKQ